MSKRNFVPENFNPDDVKETSKLYRALLQRDIPVNVDKLRQWILDWSELESVLGEVSSRRYVAMTCDTRDEKAAKAYADFVENIQPLMIEYDDKLNRKLMAHPSKDALKGEFGEWLKGVQVSLDLFSPDNIPLETEENKAIQAYQKITGGMSVEFDGEVKTMQQLGAYMEKTDRSLRERAWRAMWERRLQDKDALDQSYDKLFSIRKQMAKNAHCKDFIDYIFLAKHRFDYTPADCEAFHESIEKLVLPLQKEMYKRRAKKMGLDRLRPWDLDVDPLSRPPLKPYQSGDELIEKVDSIFESIHAQAGKWAREMQAKKLIDPDSRLGKAPGGYQIGLTKAASPSFS